MTGMLIGMLLFGGLLLLVGGLVAGEAAVASTGLVAAGVAGYFEYSAGRLSTLGVLLLAGGVAALVAELALPSGLAGAAGAGLLVAALSIGWDAPELVTIPMALVMAASLFLLWKTGMSRGLTGVPDLQRGGGRAEQTIGVGSEGTAVTALRPGGTARFGGRNVEVRLREGSAEPGERVVMVEAADMMLLVDLLSEQEPPPHP